MMETPSSDARGARFDSRLGPTSPVSSSSSDLAATQTIPTHDDDSDRWESLALEWVLGPTQAIPTADENHLAHDDEGAPSWEEALDGGRPPKLAKVTEVDADFAFPTQPPVGSRHSVAKAVEIDTDFAGEERAYPAWPERKAVQPDQPSGNSVAQVFIWIAWIVLILVVKILFKVVVISAARESVSGRGGNQAVRYEAVYVTPSTSPFISQPTVNLPGVHLPNVDMPSVHLPNVGMPGVKVSPLPFPSQRFNSVGSSWSGGHESRGPWGSPTSLGGIGGFGGSVPGGFAPHH